VKKELRRSLPSQDISIANRGARGASPRRGGRTVFKEMSITDDAGHEDYRGSLRSSSKRRLFWSGYRTLPIHRRDPTTARHGDFCLLRFRPRPVHPSLGNLVAPSSPGATILMPSLVRTPDRHRTSTGRTPDLKPSTDPGLQVAGLQEHATQQICSYSNLSKNIQIGRWCAF